MVALYLAMKSDNEDWSNFSAAHNCRIVGKVSSDLLVIPVIGNKGSVSIAVTETPDKTGYSCDDGVTYWR